MVTFLNNDNNTLWMSVNNVAKCFYGLVIKYHIIFRDFCTHIYILQWTLHILIIPTTCHTSSNPLSVRFEYLNGRHSKSHLICVERWWWCDVFTFQSRGVVKCFHTRKLIFYVVYYLCTDIIIELLNKF